MKLATLKLPIVLSLTAHGVILGGVGFGFAGNSEVRDFQNQHYFTVSFEKGVPDGDRNSNEIEQPAFEQSLIEVAPVVSLNPVKEISREEPQKSKPAPQRNQRKEIERKGSVLPALGVQEGSGESSGGAGLGLSFLTASMKFAPKPPYPPVARKVGAEGTVVLNAIIDQLGAVKKVSMITSSGRHDLDDAAQSTVASKWRFNPARKEGIPVESEEQVVVVFRLEG